MHFEFVPEHEKIAVAEKHGVNPAELILQLPERASVLSAGYDFVLPFDVRIPSGGQVVIPTFVRVKLESNRALFIYPRSSCAIKKGIILSNTVGIIDADYFGNPDNSGHIFIALKNTSSMDFFLGAGARFAQGIIQEFFLVDGDDFSKGKKRLGGIGSTGEIAAEVISGTDEHKACDPELVSIDNCVATKQIKSLANLFYRSGPVCDIMHEVTHGEIDELLLADETVNGQDIRLRLAYKGFAYVLSLYFNSELRLSARFGRLGMSEKDFAGFMNLLKEYGVGGGWAYSLSSVDKH